MICSKDIRILQGHFMDTIDYQQHFEGYLNTPLLWQHSDICHLKQFVLRHLPNMPFTEKIEPRPRLGKLVERFVVHHLLADTSIQIIAENLQILAGKQTLGELDLLIATPQGPIHLELAYKFYLYAPQGSLNEISHWIGPNKTDNLLDKLSKLKHQQLPLLYHPKVQEAVKALKIKSLNIKQQVLFKAQLYLPFGEKPPEFMALNPNCVQGFYLRKKDLYQFKNAQFYIPEKIDWLLTPPTNGAWLDFEAFITRVSADLDKKKAPLCWLQHQGAFQKFFVVWW